MWFIEEKLLGETCKEESEEDKEREIAEQGVGLGKSSFVLIP